MAPAQCQRQVLIWTLPALAVIISFFWYKRKKTSIRSDPGGTCLLEKSSERVDNHSISLNCITTDNSEKVFAAIEKAKRDIETSKAIEEIACIDSEEDTVVTNNKTSNCITIQEDLATIKQEFFACEESLPAVKKEIIFDSLIESTPVKDNNCEPINFLKQEDNSVVEVDQINDKEGIELCAVSSFEKKNNFDLMTTEEVIDKSFNKVCNKSLDEASLVKKSTELNKENTAVNIVKLNQIDCRCEKKDSSSSLSKDIVEDTCIKKVLNDTSNETKVIESPTKNNKSNKVSGSKKRSNKKSVKDSNVDKINNKIDLKDVRKSDKGKEKKVVIKSDSREEEKLNLKSVTSTSVKKYNQVIPENKKMELACSRVEHLGHNSSQSVINGNEDGLEHKLASLELDSSHNSEEGGERDSANHSPAEVMLASPSMSNFSDAHSEGSSDSGKGCSDIPDINTPPSQTPAGGSSVAGDLIPSVYEFIIPQHLVGRLIGRHGVFLHEIRSKTHTHVFIKRHPETNRLKICAIEGAQQDIDAALDMIRQKFPLRRFPNLTLERVTFVNVLPPVCPLPQEQFQLQLIEGLNNDVVLSSLISAGHFFLQQPMHPTYQDLCGLNLMMNTVYNSPEAPILDTPVKDAICAAPAMDGWYRAQIIDVDEDNKMVDVRFLDYGGFLTLEVSALRKIRADFMMLPFQAVECILAKVFPAGGEDAEWTEEARLFIQNITCGQVLQAFVSEYTETGIPLVFLYAMYCGQVVLVNQELVDRGFADMYPDPVAAEE